VARSSGDIKPENILMLSADNTTIKLTDFGFAAKCEDDFCLHEGCGSPSYVAPEILLRVPYGRPVDIWSIGVVGYILLCGYAPFNAANDKLMFELIKQGKFRFHSDAWEAISDDAKDLISHLLVVNATTRFTAKQALAHPWVSDKNSIIWCDVFLC
jgi:serine/threonine protein kinase